MDYDVAVVGAGPAGGSTALHLARDGFSVVVLEEHDVVGEPIHCGECVSDLCFERVGLTPPDDVISLKVKGIRVIFPDGSSRTVTEPGSVLDKELFEKWLIEESVREGVALRLSHKVTAAERIEGGWSISAGDEVLTARVLVDGSGHAGVLSGMLGLNPSSRKIVGLQYLMDDIWKPDEDPTPYLDFYIWPAMAREGYLWVIPKAGGRANVGLVTTEKGGQRRNLHAFIERMGYPLGEDMKRMGGSIPISGPKELTHADGIVLVGDAAGFTSPMFEGGTHLSLMSGRYAAEAISRALKADDVSDTMLSEYERLWRSTFPDYTKILAGKDLFYSLSEEELNAISATLPPEMGAMSRMDKLAIGGRLVKQGKGLVRKGAVKALVALGESRAKRYGW